MISTVAWTISWSPSIGNDFSIHGQRKPQWRAGVAGEIFATMRASPVLRPLHRHSDMLHSGLENKSSGYNSLIDLSGRCLKPMSRCVDDICALVQGYGTPEHVAFCWHASSHWVM
jgi:hypothetical protein